MAIGSDVGIKAAQIIALPGAVDAMNIFYFKTDFQEEQEEEDVVDAIVTWMEAFYDNIIGNMSDQAELGLMKVYYLTALSNEWILFGEDTPVKAFTDATEMLPHGVAALLRAYTTRGKTIGRKYIPAFCEDAQEDGEWVVGALANLLAATVDWGNIAFIDANNNLAPAIYSYGQEYVYELTDVFVVPVHPGYQRRRRPGVGT